MASLVPQKLNVWLLVPSVIVELVSVQIHSIYREPAVWTVSTVSFIRESLPQFQNRIMAWLYIRNITRSTMY